MDNRFFGSKEQLEQLILAAIREAVASGATVLHLTADFRINRLLATYDSDDDTANLFGGR